MFLFCFAFLSLHYLLTCEILGAAHLAQAFHLFLLFSLPLSLVKVTEEKDPLLCCVPL